MSFVKWAFIGLLLLPIAEVATFIVVSLVLGWLLTVVLFVGTTIAGVLVLRHSGRADFNRLRSAVTNGGLRAINLDTPGMGGIVGSILLVLPGFLTDLLGLLLFMPSLRRWVGATLGRARREYRPSRPRSRATKSDPAIIDLEPEEWHQITDGKADSKKQVRRRKRPLDQAL
jgi:UPF0716 protein FxsA